MQTNIAPLYFADAATSDFIKDYDEIIDAFLHSKEQVFCVEATPDVIEAGDVTMPLQLILALQHHPKVIEKMMLSIDIIFAEVEGSELYIPPNVWKRDVKYYSWFHKLMYFPPVLFFIHDMDARFYILAGDLLATRSVKVEEIDKEGRATMAFTGEQLNTLRKRIFNCSLYLLFYCHGSGFNPEQYIQAILADFDMDVQYEDIHKQYLKELKEGIKFKTVIKR